VFAVQANSETTYGINAAAAAAATAAAASAKDGNDDNNDNTEQQQQQQQVVDVLQDYNHQDQSTVGRDKYPFLLRPHGDADDTYFSDHADESLHDTYSHLYGLISMLDTKDARYRFSPWRILSDLRAFSPGTQLSCILPKMQDGPLLFLWKTTSSQSTTSAGKRLLHMHNTSLTAFGILYHANSDIMLLSVILGHSSICCHYTLILITTFTDLSQLLPYLITHTLPSAVNILKEMTMMMTIILFSRHC